MGKKRLSKAEKIKLIDEVTPIVQEFKQKYSLNQPILDSFKTIEDNIGYFIVSKKANEELSGFQYKIGEQGFIFVNNHHDLGRQNHSLWHEVYHLYTGDGEPISSDEVSQNYKESEFRANQFASMILVDRDILKSVINEKKFGRTGWFNEREIIELQNIFQVSFSNVCFILNELYPTSIPGRFFNVGNIKNREELLKMTRDFGFDTKISEIPKDDYISPIIFDYLEQNLNDGRTSLSRVQEIVDFISMELRLDDE